MGRARSIVQVTTVEYGAHRYPTWAATAPLRKEQTLSHHSVLFQQPDEEGLQYASRVERRLRELSLPPGSERRLRLLVSPGPDTLSWPMRLTMCTTALRWLDGANGSLRIIVADSISRSTRQELRDLFGTLTEWAISRNAQVTMHWVMLGLSRYSPRHANSRGRLLLTWPDRLAAAPSPQ